MTTKFELFVQRLTNRLSSEPCERVATYGFYIPRHNPTASIMVPPRRATTRELSAATRERLLACLDKLQSSKAENG